MEKTVGKTTNNVKGQPHPPYWLCVASMETVHAVVPRYVAVALNGKGSINHQTFGSPI